MFSIPPFRVMVRSGVQRIFLDHRRDLDHIASQIGLQPVILAFGENIREMEELYNIW